MVDIIYSFWSPFKTAHRLQNQDYKKSLNISKKMGHKCHLFCCEKSYEILKNEPWDSVHLDLEQLNKNYKYTWSLGKITTYHNASKIFDNFAHLDFDTTLIKPLEIDNSNNDFTIFYKEDPIHYKAFNTNEYLGWIPEEIKIRPKEFYNMAIFGGKSIEIYEYSKKALEFIYNKENEKFFCNEKYYDTFGQALFGEQFYFSSYCNFFNKKVKVLCENTERCIARHK